jgi:hypothetical protein
MASANLYFEPEITLTRRPVLALSSVTEVSFATQTWVPSEAMAAGTSNLYREPEITLTRRPVLALSSVTDSPSMFATQT